MTGRKNNRTSALGRYLEAASSSSNNGNLSNQLCGAENDLNHKNSNQAPAPAPAPQPLYASQALRDTSNMNPFNKNSSNDNIIHPPTTIEQMPPDPDQLHVLSDVTSDSDLTGDDDQTMSLLSREEKISHSSQRGKNPNMNQERPKSFRYLRSQTAAYTNNQQETSNGPSAPSTNKWKDALRRKSKQKSYLRSSQSPSDINKDDNNSKSTSRSKGSKKLLQKIKVVTPPNKYKNRREISMPLMDHPGGSEKPLNGQQHFIPTSETSNQNNNTVPSSWKHALRRKTMQYQSHEQQQPEDEEEEDQRLQHQQQQQQQQQYNEPLSRNLNRKHENGRRKDFDKREQSQDGSAATLHNSTSPNASCETGMQTVEKWGSSNQNKRNAMNHSFYSDSEVSQQDSILSVKDRIRRFGGTSTTSGSAMGETNSNAVPSTPNSKRSFQAKTKDANGFKRVTNNNNNNNNTNPPPLRQGYNNNPMETNANANHNRLGIPPMHRNYPPQSYNNTHIIYDEEDEDDHDGEIPLAPQPSRIPPSPLAAAAADAAAELVRRSMAPFPDQRNDKAFLRNSNMNGNMNSNHTTSNVASNFLAAVRSNSTGISHTSSGTGAGAGAASGSANGNGTGPTIASDKSNDLENSRNSNRNSGRTGRTEERNMLTNAKSRLRSSSLPRGNNNVRRRDSSVPPSKRDTSVPRSTTQSMNRNPFRFDIPEEQVRHSVTQATQQTVHKVREQAKIIEQDTIDAIRQSSPKFGRNNNGSTASSGAGTNKDSSVVSREDVDRVERVMDQKLKVMEDRLKIQMNDRMEELETVMENKMDEIHGLLLKLFEKRAPELGRGRG